MYAALHGDAQSVKLLLDHGADPNDVNKIGATALLWGSGDIEKVRLLLKHGANPNVQSDLGNTPLIMAAAYPKSTSVVEMLLQHGANLKAKNKRGVTALRSAVIAGDAQTVRLLLGKGAVLDADEDSSSDISIAAGRGYKDIVEMLLDHGADPNAGDGRDSLNAALLAQKPEIARRLIK